MKKAKKIISLALTLVVIFSLFTMNIPTMDALAIMEENPWYSEEMDGVYTVDLDELDNRDKEVSTNFLMDVKDLKFKIENRDMEISFNALNPNTNKREYVKETIVGVFDEKNWSGIVPTTGYTSYDIETIVNHKEFGFFIVQETPGKYRLHFWKYRDLSTESPRCYFSPPLFALKKEASPVEPFTFKQSVFSNLTTPKGEYELNVSAFIHTVVNDGVNALTLEEIKKQYITIQAINTVTGEYRVMDQNTIEGIRITAADGKATEITINGRVQTKNGKLERYVTTITL